MIYIEVYCSHAINDNQTGMGQGVLSLSPTPGTSDNYRGTRDC